MPHAPTTRLGIVLPSGGDSPPDVAGDYKAAWDALDTQAAIDDQGTYAAVPAATSARRGMYYWATDRRLLYRCTGTEWVRVDDSSPIVTSLPTTSGGSYEGQRVTYQPVSGAHWDLRRVGPRWVPIGRQVAMTRLIGPPVYATGSASWNTHSSADGLTVPADGYYDISARCDIGISGDPTGRLYEIVPARVNSGPITPLIPTARYAFSGIQSLSAIEAPTPLLAAGDDVRLAYRASGWTGLPSYTVGVIALTMAPRSLVAS